MRLLSVIIIVLISQRLITWIHQDIPKWSWAESLPFSIDAWHNSLYDTLASLAIIIFAVVSFITLWRIFRSSDTVSNQPHQPPSVIHSRGTIKIILIVLTVIIFIYVNSHIQLPKFLEISFLLEFSWYTQCELVAFLTLIIVLVVAYLIILVFTIKNQPRPLTPLNNISNSSRGVSSLPKSK